MNSIIWFIFQLGYLEVALIYACILTLIVVFSIRSYRRRKRAEYAFLTTSIALIFAFPAAFNYSFRYTEHDSLLLIQNIIEGQKVQADVDWRGDEMEFPVLGGKVSSFDEFLGSWDLRIDTSSGKIYDLSVTKREGIWIVYSSKEKM